MGNKAAKPAGKTVSPEETKKINDAYAQRTVHEVKDDDYYWNNIDTILAPVESCDDFCARFKGATKADYDKAMDFYQAFIEDNPGGEKDYITHDSWMGGAPEHGEKLFQKIWDAFDVDGDGQLSKGEFLLYEGLRSHGSLEQRVIASFVMNDKDHDHNLCREEISAVFTDAVDVVGLKYTPEFLKVFVDKCLEKGDKNGDGFLQVSEIIAIAYSDKNFAQVFGSL